LLQGSSKIGLLIFLKFDIFLNRKMVINRKIPNQKEMINLLRSGKLVLPPLSFRVFKDKPETTKNIGFDLLVEASWRGSTARFAVECKALSTPKAFKTGLNLLKNETLPKGCWPLLFLPFLSEQQLQELEQEQISGIDLCGNGVVVVPGKFVIFRSSGKNRFSSSAPIKNIYRKNSSMVARVLLSCPGYETVQEVCSEVNRRNTLVDRWNKSPMSLSTVSKSLKALEEDLIIDRKETIRLLQPDKLLEKLSQNYASPNIKDRIRMKVQAETETLQQLLRRQSQELGLPIVAAGTSSVGLYAVMQRGDLLTVYCPRLEMLLERLPGSRTDRFPNVELVETDDETVYFDARGNTEFWWASPVQVYLELMAGDKRDRETAEQVRSLILKDIEQARQ
jgi:hypothetical protein